MTTVTLSLVSHTNVGKTTLARTLLRRDVGEVLDQPHVTDVSEAHELIAAAGHRLLLWDTPGFGATARLAARLRREASPLGWLLHQVWDRFTDRPLWCSQEAVRNVREDADLVLYLVNAAEDPGGAGYVALELEILSWIGKPVLVLLNQTGPPRAGLERDIERWRAVLQGRAPVRDVLGLDAFSRCWVQEGVLLERVARELDGERRAALEVLARAWNGRNLQVFESSCERMAVFLALAAADRAPLPGEDAGRPQKRRAMEALALRLEAAERELWDAVIAEHGLEGRMAREVRKRLEDFDFEGAAPLTAGKGALIGSIVTGALGGLAADLLAGGLTLGGGLIAGALLGALGGAGLTSGFRLVRARGEPQVRWSAEFLAELARRTLLRYLALAHSGRGRGPFEEEQPLERWRSAVERALDAGSPLREALRSPPADSGSLEPLLRTRLRQALAEVLADAYPAARALLER